MQQQDLSAALDDLFDDLIYNSLIPSPDEENPSLANAASSALDPPGPLRPGRFRSLRFGIRRCGAALRTAGLKPYRSPHGPVLVLRRASAHAPARALPRPASARAGGAP